MSLSETADKTPSHLIAKLNINDVGESSGVTSPVHTSHQLDLTTSSTTVERPKKRKPSRTLSNVHYALDELPSTPSIEEKSETPQPRTIATIDGKRRARVLKRPVSPPPVTPLTNEVDAFVATHSDEEPGVSSPDTPFPRTTQAEKERRRARREEQIRQCKQREEIESRKQRWAMRSDNQSSQSMASEPDLLPSSPGDEPDTPQKLYTTHQNKKKRRVLFAAS